MRRTLQSGLAAAVLVVDPKDEQAARFYYRYGFLDIGPGRRRLYMPVTEIKKALS
jgi:ribosomal protein S18 acetylase RimI-like enzyme